MGLCYVMSEVLFQFLTGACTDGRMSVNDTSRSKFSIFLSENLLEYFMVFECYTLIAQAPVRLESPF